MLAAQQLFEYGQRRSVIRVMCNRRGNELASPLSSRPPTDGNCGDDRSGRPGGAIEAHLGAEHEAAAQVYGHTESEEDGEVGIGGAYASKLAIGTLGGKK
jgi:hypothetical protein